MKNISLILFFLFTVNSYAQVDKSIAFIKLHDNVGYVIDSTENLHHNCIPNSNSNLFRHAILIQRTDSFVVLRIKELHRNGYRNEIMTRYSLQKMHIAATKTKRKAESSISEEQERKLLKDYAAKSSFTLIDYEKVQMPSYLYKQHTREYYDGLIYEVWLELMDESGTIQGALYELRDSSIILATSTRIKDFKANNYSLVKIQATNIKKIKLRNSEAPLIGFAIGASSGAVAGAAIGFAQGTTPGTCAPGQIFFCSRRISATEKAIKNGIRGLTGAGLAGYIACSIIKKKFIVEGNLLTYQRIKLKLEKYSIAK